MTATQESALTSFTSGLNCAQSVVTTYSGIFNFDALLVQNISCAFGGGMGRLQETCGAVTGAFMVLSIVVSQQVPEPAERKKKTYAMVQEFNRRFTAIHGTKSCRLLLGCDLNTEEGHEYFKHHDLTSTVCRRCITDAVAIVDELTIEP